jgi:hypothetical protein
MLAGVLDAGEHEMGRLSPTSRTCIGVGTRAPTGEIGELADLPLALQRLGALAGSHPPISEVFRALTTDTSTTTAHAAAALIVARALRWITFPTG